MAAYRDIRNDCCDPLIESEVSIPDCDFVCEECKGLFDCNVILEFHEFWDVLTARHRSQFGETGDRPH
jgi:hypothetical protein